MKLFQIENFEAVPSEEFLLIEEFRDLFSPMYNKTDDDKSGRFKKRGTAEAKFIFFMYDHRSEFSKYSGVERQKEALSAAGLPEDYKLSAKLLLAIDRFNKLKDSRNLRLLDSANQSVDKLSDYFKAIDYAKLDANGKFVYDPKDVISNIGNLGKVIEGLNALEEAVRKDEGEESSTRGQAEKGRLA